MSRKAETPAVIVMGLHAQYRGFGWAIFERPSAPMDWGITYARGDREEACVHQLATLFERYRPEVLVFEQPRRRFGWAVRLCALAASLAESRGIEVRKYSHADLCNVLGAEQGAARHTIAVQVAEHLNAFHYRLPPKRKPWDGSDRRMALFMAAAAALTHYALGVD